MFNTNCIINSILGEGYEGKKESSIVTSATVGKMINFFVGVYKLKYNQIDLILLNLGIVRF